MTELVVSSATGWLAAILVAVNISLPYLLRGRLLAACGWSVPYLDRMQPHYWIGVTIGGLSLVHAGVAMSGPMKVGNLYVAGLWIATGALMLVIGQLMVGMRLRTVRGAERLRLRRTHFRIMVGLVMTGAVHVVLNGLLP